jgi:peptidoglycan/LPS O-acetylase OafA/YrhL
MPINLQRLCVSDHLGLIRGLAAITVLIYHIRYRFFFDYNDVTAPDWFSFLFYTLSAFGHDAVIVFFVLSGYFISASVFRDQTAGRWSWKRYLVNRFTRLYLVLLPALLLTALWDSLGLGFYSDNPIYSGEQRPWSHDFFRVSDRLSVGTFVANTLFLQSIQAPPFGSNEPLWSLSYEFWYYVLFPLAWFALVRPARVLKSAVHLMLFIGLLVAMGTNIRIYFPIWLLGTVVCLLPQVSCLKREQSPITSFVALGLFCSVVAATHVRALKNLLDGSIIVSDYITAITFALLLYFMLHNRAPGGHGGIYAKISKSLANFSYTLYVVHMPVLVFLRAALLPDTPWPADPSHVGFGVAIALGCVVYAYVLSRLIEAKTDLIRDKLMNLLSMRKDSGSGSSHSKMTSVGLVDIAQHWKMPGKEVR